LKELGVKDMDVSRTEKQIAADASGITLPRGPVSAKAFRELVKKVPAKDRQAARLAFEKDPRDTTTPRAMAELLVRFTKGELLSKDSTELLRDALRRCKTGDKRIRALLPPGTLVFDKTGTAARCTNDVGLVRLPDGRELAVAVYVKSSPKPPETRERTIAELARAAYQEFASPRAAAVITRRRSASV
jgi:beta-lactamase class A